MANAELTPEHHHFHRDDLLHYLDRCQMPEGGFCSFRDPESGAGFSNVADTFFALSSYRLLGEEPPGINKTKDWLLRILESDNTLSTSPYLSWALSAKVLLGFSVSYKEKELLRTETIRLLKEIPPDFERYSLIHDLAALMEIRIAIGYFLEGGDRATLSKFLLRQRTSLQDLTILELADRSSLSEIAGMGEPDLPNESLYRHPILGYVLVPGSSRSDLFILWAGLRLRDEGLTLEEAASLRTRILFCQERSGGFGPLGGAVPSLESTRTALQLLVFFGDGLPE